MAAQVSDAAMAARLDEMRDQGQALRTDVSHFGCFAFRGAKSRREIGHFAFRDAKPDTLHFAARNRTLRDGAGENRRVSGAVLRRDSLNARALGLDRVSWSV